MTIEMPTTGNWLRGENIRNRGINAPQLWDDEEHAGSFTNRPELQGQIDPDTGKEWIYTPDQSYWRDYEKNPVTHPEITMGDGRATIESPTFGYSGSMEDLPRARELMAKDEETLRDAQRRKTEEAQAAEEAKGKPTLNRQKLIGMYYEKFGNPDDYNIEAEVAKDMIEEEKTLRKTYDIDENVDMKLVHPQIKAAFSKNRAQQERTIYQRNKDEQQRMVKHRDFTFEQIDNAIKDEQTQITAQQKAQKLTKGDVFTDEEGYRVRPFYNKEGEIVRKTRIGKAEVKKEKLTDFKFAFDLWKKRNSKGTVEQFKREWEKPTGGLTEGAVVKSINEMSWNAEDPVKWTTDTYNKYLGHRTKGLSREEALNKVQQEMNEIKLPPEIKTTSKAMEYLKKQGMTEQQAKDWLRSQR